MQEEDPRLENQGSYLQIEVVCLVFDKPSVAC